MRSPRNEPLGAGIAGAPPAPGQGSERRCILTGGKAGRDELVRLAIAPPGADGRCLVLPDALAKAPGRGAWIGVGRDELAEALARGRLKGALSRAFRGMALEIPPDLPERIEAALVRALADRLGLEQRAGALITGSDRIAGEARQGRVVALYHAADASPDGCRKLDQAWRVGKGAENSGLAGARLPLDRQALSVALGRENVVHLALTTADAARRVAIPLMRLEAFLGGGLVAGAGARSKQSGRPVFAEPTN